MAFKHYKGPNPTKGIAAFAQDATKAFSGYHPEQGQFSADKTKAEKRRSPVVPSFNRFTRSKGSILAKVRAMGVPKSTNWRTSAKPIKK